MGIIKYKTDTNAYCLKVNCKNRGWKLDKNKWNVFWGMSGKCKSFFQREHGCRLNDDQFINHFPNSYVLTRKDFMPMVIRKYVKELEKIGKSQPTLIPSTYVLPREYASFLEEYNDEPDATWILKPCCRSQGYGIFLATKLTRIKKLGRMKTSNNCGGMADNRSYVVCRYIERPLLIGGKKFDMRMYVLVTSFKPLKAYLFKSGFCRFAVNNYYLSNENLKNQYTHITNHSVQRRSIKYNKIHGEKWSTINLQLYLEGTIGITLTNTLFKNIKDLIIHSLKAAQMVISSNQHCFECYGYDIIIDSDLKPWLIEVNASPSIVSSTYNDRVLKKKLINNIFSIVLPPEGKKPNVWWNKIPSKEAMDNFERLIDEDLQPWSNDKLNRERKIQSHLLLTKGLNRSFSKKKRGEFYKIRSPRLNIKLRNRMYRPRTKHSLNILKCNKTCLSFNPKRNAFNDPYENSLTNVSAISCRSYVDKKSTYELSFENINSTTKFNNNQHLSGKRQSFVNLDPKCEYKMQYNNHYDEKIYDVTNVPKKDIADNIHFHNNIKTENPGFNTSEYIKDVKTFKARQKTQYEDNLFKDNEEGNKQNNLIKKIDSQGLKDNTENCRKKKIEKQASTDSNIFENQYEREKIYRRNQKIMTPNIVEDESIRFEGIQIQNFRETIISSKFQDDNFQNLFQDTCYPENIFNVKETAKQKTQPLANIFDNGVNNYVSTFDLNHTEQNNRKEYSIQKSKNSFYQTKTCSINNKTIDNIFNILKSSHDIDVTCNEVNNLKVATNSKNTSKIWNSNYNECIINNNHEASDMQCPHIYNTITNIFESLMGSKHKLINNTFCHHGINNNKCRANNYTYNEIITDNEFEKIEINSENSLIISDNINNENFQPIQLNNKEKRYINFNKEIYDNKILNDEGSRKENGKHIYFQNNNTISENITRTYKNRNFKCSMSETKRNKKLNKEYNAREIYVNPQCRESINSINQTSNCCNRKKLKTKSNNPTSNEKKSIYNPSIHFYHKKYGNQSNSTELLCFDSNHKIDQNISIRNQQVINCKDINLENINFKICLNDKQGIAQNCHSSKYKSNSINNNLPKSINYNEVITGINMDTSKIYSELQGMSTEKFNSRSCLDLRVNFLKVKSCSRSFSSHHDLDCRSSSSGTLQKGMSLPASPNTTRRKLDPRFSLEKDTFSESAVNIRLFWNGQDKKRLNSEAFNNIKIEKCKNVIASAGESHIEYLFENIRNCRSSLEESLEELTKATKRCEKIPINESRKTTSNKNKISLVKNIPEKTKNPRPTKNFSSRESSNILNTKSIRRKEYLSNDLINANATLRINFNKNFNDKIKDSSVKNIPEKHIKNIRSIISADTANTKSNRRNKYLSNSLIDDTHTIKTNANATLRKSIETKNCIKARRLSKSKSIDENMEINNNKNIINERENCGNEAIYKENNIHQKLKSYNDIISKSKNILDKNNTKSNKNIMKYYNILKSQSISDDDIQKLDYVKNTNNYAANLNKNKSLPINIIPKNINNACKRRPYDEPYIFSRTLLNQISVSNIISNEQRSSGIVDKSFNIVKLCKKEGKMSENLSDGNNSSFLNIEKLQLSHPNKRKSTCKMENVLCPIKKFKKISINKQAVNYDTKYLNIRNNRRKYKIRNKIKKVLIYKNSFYSSNEILRKKKQISRRISLKVRAKLKKNYHVSVRCDNLMKRPIKKK